MPPNYCAASAGNNCPMCNDTWYEIGEGAAARMENRKCFSPSQEIGFIIEHECLQFQLARDCVLIIII